MQDTLIEFTVHDVSFGGGEKINGKVLDWLMPACFTYSNPVQHAPGIT